MAAADAVHEWSLTRPSLPRNELNHVYCVGLVKGDKIVLEYSGPWSLKAKVTSRRAKGWKDLLCHRAVDSPNFPECERMIEKLFAVFISPQFLIYWIFLRQKNYTNREITTTWYYVNSRRHVDSEKIRVPDGIWTHDPPWSSRIFPVNTHIWPVLTTESPVAQW